MSLYLRIEALSDTVNRIAEIATFLVISAMAVVVFVEVIFRYVLLLPLFWTEEFARYCLVWSSLLGAGVALKRGEHIAVTFFAGRFPKVIRMETSLLVELFIAAFLVIIFWGGLSLFIITRHQLSPAMRIPMSWPYMAVPLGSLIMLVHESAFIYLRLKEMTASGRRNT